MFSLRSSIHATALVLASAVMFASVSLPAPARAADPSHDKKMTYGEFMKMDPAECMKMMDPNNKGYVTKQEFLKFQEQLFDNTPKSAADRITREEWIKNIHSSP